MSLLEVESVGHTYRVGSGGTLRALTDVSLSLAAGEILALVGESGAGKSTLARLIVGLERPMSGKVRIEGREPSEQRGRARAWAQLVFQDAGQSLNPRRTVGQAIAEPLAVHDLAPDVDARVTSLLAEVGLSADMAGRAPHTLSGGEKQRVVLARALAVEPKLLVADEPLASLDVPLQDQVLDLLGRLVRERQLGLILIGHDLLTLARKSQRLSVLYLGRVVEHGPADELVTSPRHPYTRALVAAAPRTSGPPAVTLHGDAPSILTPPAGCAFHPRCPLAEARCRTELPPLRPFGGAKVACHLV